jgi:hypothetical protein
MPSSRILRHLALVSTNVTEELSGSIIRVTRIGELGITLAVTTNPRNVKMEALRSFETSVLTTTTQMEFLSHHRENLKSDIIMIFCVGS